MKIADIQFYSFNPGRRNLQVVRVESDNGYFGWGEAGLCSRDLAVGGAVSHFRDFLIGRIRGGSGGSGRRRTAASTSRAGGC